MQIKVELILFLVSIASTGFGALLFAWKIGVAVSTMKSALKEQITATDFDRKLNEKGLEHLQDTLKLGFNGFEEKFNHFSGRVRSEIIKCQASG